MEFEEHYKTSFHPSIRINCRASHAAGSPRGFPKAGTHVPRSLLSACQRRFGDAVAPELLRSQIELVSPVFERHEQAAEELTRLRRGIAEIAAEKDLRLMASGTRPIAAWGEQIETPKARYRKIIDDFQIIGRRNVLCGLHIHVAVPGDVDRVMLMNRVMHWLPVFLALSTSSPFWNRAMTGLLSYRQSAYDEWPRTGIPDHFRNEAEYAQLVNMLSNAGAIKDAGYLWWVIRPALLTLYREARDRGDSRIKALHSVVDWLMGATVPSA